jgi:hypothetical protein
MPDTPDFDLQAAHRFFAAECFNRAWDLIDKPDRTPDEDEQMIRLSLASTWHWTQRDDCAPANLSVGYWQTSRIYALLGQTANARRYAQLCLAVSQGEGMLPFYLGYAYEALARAESVAANGPQRDAYLAAAREVAGRMPDPDARQALLADLATIR